MSLPEEYRTARFESLPGDLKAKAEAIIKKKFDLKEEKKYNKTSVFAQGYTTVDTSMFYTDWADPIAIKRRPVLRLKEVQYNYSGRMYRVIVNCRSCGFTDHHTIPASVVEGRGFERFYTCSCGAERLFVPDDEFYRAYKEEMSRTRSEFIPPDFKLY